jgi:DNA-binding winged helix-turn-helix (wHTH) protein
MAASENRDLPQDASFRLGPWLVEPKLNRISDSDTSLQVDLRVMQLLVFLASRAGEVVSRYEILDAVWDTHFVADNTLTRAIAEIRRTLGDDPRHPTSIETIPKRGYRLIAPVTPLEAAPSESAEGLPRFRLVGSAGEFELHEGDNLIGREPGLEVTIASSNASRRHARIVIEGERAVLEDLGSKNGTFVGDAQLTEPTELSHGAEIRIGRKAAVLRFLADADQTRTDSSLEVEPEHDAREP